VIEYAGRKTGGGDAVAQPELATLFGPVHPALMQVEQGLWEALQAETPEVQEPLRHLALAGGKRIRPALVLLGARVGDGGGQAALDTAVAAELIHMATLVHDDVIDRADVRRGQPTVEALWSTRVAVLAGDSMFARAFSLLAATHIPALTESMARAVRAMSEGEIQQNLESRRRLIPTEEGYFRRIAKKTAVFLAECVRAGAIAGGVVGEALSRLYDFGYQAGLAYQVVDDLLDLEGDPSRVGKGVGADLAEGIVTLPVLRALDRTAPGSPEHDQLLGAVRGEVAARDILPLLRSTGALASARATARELMDKARQALTGLALGREVAESFEQVAAYLAQRSA
jgi:heptaprenyl diphosphate synthase